MKRAAAFLTLVICFIYMTNFNFVSATSATIPGDFVNYGDIMGLQDIGYALIGGAQFDFDSSKYVIEDYSSLSAAGKLEAEREKIKEFLADYEASRGISYSYNESALYQGQSYYTTAFTQNANQKIEEYTISSENVDWAIGISPYKFADWATYNRFWINKYANSFIEDDSATVNPDPNYAQYIENINGTGFWWEFYANSDGSANKGLEIYPPSLCSWFAQQTISFSPSWVYVESTSIRNIYITSLNGVYSCSISIPANEFYYNFCEQNTPRYQVGTPYNNCFYYSGNAYNFTYTISGTLQQVFEGLQTKCRNVNIYVDGVAWSLAGAPANPLIPTFPDVITQDQDLAYDIPFPNTDTYEGTFDLTSVLDAIGKAISGASDSDGTTSSVLTGEDVTDSYDGVNIDTQDKVVDLVSTKVFDGTLDTTTTDRLPDIPVPPQPIINGLGGATVLAKYIDATQCILPEEVVLAFWGGFFILIILGLIKNLHR